MGRPQLPYSRTLPSGSRQLTSHTSCSSATAHLLEQAVQCQRSYKGLGSRSTTQVAAQPQPTSLNRPYSACAALLSRPRQTTTLTSRNSAAAHLLEQAVQRQLVVVAGVVGQGLGLLCNSQTPATASSQKQSRGQGAGGRGWPPLHRRKICWVHFCAQAVEYRRQVAAGEAEVPHAQQHSSSAAAQLGHRAATATATAAGALQGYTAPQRDSRAALWQARACNSHAGCAPSCRRRPAARLAVQVAAALGNSAGGPALLPRSTAAKCNYLASPGEALPLTGSLIKVLLQGGGSKGQGGDGIRAATGAVRCQCACCNPTDLQPAGASTIAEAAGE